MKGNAVITHRNAENGLSATIFQSEWMGANFFVRFCDDDSGIIVAQRLDLSFEAANAQALSFVFEREVRPFARS